MGEEKADSGAEGDWQGWEEVTAVHQIHLQPCFLGRQELVEAGVRSYLDTFLGKHDPSLRCIPLAYSRIDWSLAGTAAAVLADNPRAHFEVRVRWTAFVPSPGMELTGQVVSLDGTGMVVSLFALDNDWALLQPQPLLKVLVSAAELKEGGWSWGSTSSTGDDYEYGMVSRWTAPQDSRSPVPQLNDSFRLVIAGPGGPTGILGQLRRKQSKFKVTELNRKNK